MRRVAALCLLLVVIGGCGGGGGGQAVKLDGSPRFPDDEGIATSLSHERITLDGKRTYEVSDRLRSFSTYTLQIEPMLNRKGQYVQIGLDGDSMVWMAGIAAAVPVDGKQAVYYVGTLERIDDGSAIFRDGTVFRLSDRVEGPQEPGKVQARIDVATRRLVELKRVA